MRTTLLLAAALATVASAVGATTITNGLSTLGLFDDAALGNGVGLDRAGVGDAITPGCLCQGWGVSLDATVNTTYLGSNNFASSVISNVTGSSAKSTVDTGNGLTVVHDITPVVGTDLFNFSVTITNTSGAAGMVRYASIYDWDVPPGHFTDDFTTVYGGPTGIGGKLIHTSFNPFHQPDPLVFDVSFCGVAANTNAVNVPGDCGGFFIFDFGSVPAGESVTFDTVVGSARNVATLLSQFSALDVEAYHYTFDNDGPDVFGYGFVGVGLPPIPTPTPGALALFGLGLVGLAGLRRRA